MNRSLISVSALVAVGLATLPGIAASQEKSLRDSLIGSWSVTSAMDHYESGRKINNWGDVKGNITFDAAGRFSQIIIGDPQPAIKTSDPRKPDAPIVAYFGSYTVNEADKTISFKLDAASYSPRVGTPLMSTVAINGDVMSFINSPRKDQEGTFRPHVELKRAK
jgi:lipocalin-like protein